MSHTVGYFGCSVRLVPHYSDANEPYEIEMAWCSDRDPALRAGLISAVRNALLTQLPEAITGTAEYRTRTIPLSFERGSPPDLPPGSSHIAVVPARTCLCPEHEH